MNKTLAIILFIGLGLIALISRLPKGNVSAKTETTANGGANRDANGKNTEIDSSKTEETHAEPLTPGQQKQIAGLKSSLKSAKDEASQALALEKLMRAFMGFSKYDSAAIYAGQFSDSHPGITHILRAGQAYLKHRLMPLIPKKLA